MTATKRINAHTLTTDVPVHLHTHTHRAVFWLEVWNSSSCYLDLCQCSQVLFKFSSFFVQLCLLKLLLLPVNPLYYSINSLRYRSLTPLTLGPKLLISPKYYTLNSVLTESHVALLSQNQLWKCLTVSSWKLFLICSLTCYQKCNLWSCQSNPPNLSVFVVPPVMIGWICHLTNALPKQAALLKS